VGKRELGGREPARAGAGPGGETSALGWAIVAMREHHRAACKVRASDRAQAFAVIGEAVWWVTIVRCHAGQVLPGEYDNTLAGLPASRRRVAEATFGGLRFVRNRMATTPIMPTSFEPTRSDEAIGTRRSRSGPGGRLRVGSMKSA